MTGRTWRIGALADETRLTVRTLHHYDSIGLVSPSARTSGGHRIYSVADVERLYGVLVLRRLGMATADIAAALDDPAADLRAIASRQRAELDARMTALGSLRHRIDHLVDGAPDGSASPAALIREMHDVAGSPFAVRHVLALLPYDDLVDAQHRLVAMFGFEAGEITRDDRGQVVHAAVLAGTGIVHLHPVTDGLAPPGPDGVASAIVVATVSDVDAHAAHAVAHGARLIYGPADMPYGLREYGARDHAGHYWSFQGPLHASNTDTDTDTDSTDTGERVLP